MKKLSTLGLSTLALAALAACGGTGMSAATEAKLAAAAPTYQTAALQIDSTDAATPAQDSSSVQQAETSTATDDPCHPHLFNRTHEIVARLNRHTWKLLRHVEALIKANPKLTSGGSATWESIENGIDRKLTVTLQADGSYSFELDFAQVPAQGATETWTKVFYGATGEVTDATTNVSTRQANMTFDFDALHSVVSTEKAQGQITMDVTIVKDPSKPAPGEKRSMTIQFTSFLPEEGDPHGPRTGSYAHLAEPNVGGYLQFADSLVLLCPSNPNNLAADTQTFSRWLVASDGGIHGRSDALATGGQMSAGQKWEGASCYLGVKGESTNDSREASAFWLMKLEGSDGATLQGNMAQSGAAPCDPAFGVVPDLASSANDYSFSATPSFPGEW